MAVDLLFKGVPLTGHPVNLVFGEDDAPPISDATISLVATLPGLTGAVPLAIGVTVAFSGVFPSLTGSIAVTYNSNTERPTVGQVSAPWQDGADARAPMGVVWEMPMGTPVATQAAWQDGVRSSSCRMTGSFTPLLQSQWP